MRIPCWPALAVAFVASLSGPALADPRDCLVATATAVAAVRQINRLTAYILLPVHDDLAVYSAFAAEIPVILDSDKVAPFLQSNCTQNAPDSQFLSDYVRRVMYLERRMTETGIP